ncbi:hypothetical protein [Aureimonas sp. AU20]|uniref:hypothetical protein n=1 Tax=Aureimonas sp. AU20 TaxID=1349819 RepID=UPI00072171B3|nr:hypothetical protein [Aureimonas sp. AU20]ALN73568.1 hypothetical protein M673_12640 [Aureimonas sp. AU20]
MTKTPSATPSVSVESEEYVLVPREPTREMVDAGRIYGWDDPEHEASCIGHPETRASIYRAMVAAAPNPTPDFVQVPYDDFHSAYGHVPRSKMSPYRCLKTRLRSLLRADDLDHADEAEALAAAPAPNPSPAAKSGEAEAAANYDGWKSIDTAPEDEHVLLSTTGGHVGEALMLIDEDTGQQKWTWAGGPVSKFHQPLGWMPMPKALSKPVLSDLRNGGFDGPTGAE